MIHIAEALERAQIFWHRPQGVVVNPTRDSEDVALLEKLPDLKFLLRRVFDPTVDVVGNFQRRYVFVTIFLERLEREGAAPFVSAHRQKVFRRIGHQRDIFEKKYVASRPSAVSLGSDGNFW